MIYDDAFVRNIIVVLKICSAFFPLNFLRFQPLLSVKILHFFTLSASLRILQYINYRKDNLYQLYNIVTYIFFICFSVSFASILSTRFGQVCYSRLPQS